MRPLLNEIDRLRTELWVIAELIWTNASRETAKHWAQGIKVSIKGQPGEADAVKITADETSAVREGMTSNQRLLDIAETILRRPVLGHWPHMKAASDATDIQMAVARIERLTAVAEAAKTMVGAAQELPTDMVNWDRWQEMNCPQVPGVATLLLLLESKLTSLESALAAAGYDMTEAEFAQRLADDPRFPVPK